MPKALDDYMIHDADKEGPYHPGTIRHDNSKVTPFIDGKQYFDDLLSELDKLGSSGSGQPAKQGIYIAGWWIYDGFKFPCDSTRSIVDILDEKKRDGVDVKVLVWANDYVLDTQWTLADLIYDTMEDVTASFPVPDESEAFGYEFVNLVNFETAQKLRSKSLDGCVMLNTLDHPLGSVHMKYVVLFNENEVIGYTGGMDFLPDRIAENLHSSKFGFSWHDVQAKVQGDAAQAFYDHYQSLWNALRGRGYNARFKYKLIQDVSGVKKLITNEITSKTGTIAEIPNKSFSDPLRLLYPHSVQSLRTIPNTDWPWYICSEPPVLADFKDGIFEVQLALKKAIVNADTYIYIEDQGYWSREMFAMLKSAIKANANLKLIMVTGIADPNDVPAGSSCSGENYSKYAINEYLLSGLSSNEAQRIAMFARPMVTVHSKLYLIDDVVAIIGSANMFNRALYTDIEHSISFGDSIGSLIKDFRISLWGEHLGIAPPDRAATLDDLQRALNTWCPDWGTATSVFKLPHDAERFTDIPEGDWGDGFPIHPLVVQVLVPGTDVPVKGSVMSENVGQRQLTIVGFPETLYSYGRASRKVEVKSRVGFMLCFTGGPNDGFVRIVEQQSGETLTLNRALPNANDSTTKVTIYMPRLTRVKLPRPEPCGWFCKVKFEWFDDAGDHP